MTVKAHLRGGPLDGQEREMATAPRVVWFGHEGREYRYKLAVSTRVAGTTVSATYIHVDPRDGIIDKVRKYAEGLREHGVHIEHRIGGDLLGILDGDAR